MYNIHYSFKIRNIWTASPQVVSGVFPEASPWPAPLGSPPSWLSATPRRHTWKHFCISVALRCLYIWDAFPSSSILTEGELSSSHLKCLFIQYACNSTSTNVDVYIWVQCCHNCTFEMCLSAIDHEAHVEENIVRLSGQKETSTRCCAICPLVGPHHHRCLSEWSGDQPTQLVFHFPQEYSTFYMVN